MNQDTFSYERCECLPYAEHIIYRGFEGAHSDLAATQFSSQYPEAGSSHVKTFNAMMRTVDEDTGGYAVLPIENSIADSVADSYDALAEREVPVIDEYLLPVRHALLAYGDAALADIRAVYSHPQGIKQCAPFFGEHPKTEVVAVSNTAVAAQPVQAVERDNTAAIASTYAGQIYGLKVLIPILNYCAESTIRFLIVGREKLHLCGAGTVSLMIETRHEAGTLYHIPDALYAEGINLLRLTARPIPEVSWAYRSFLDFSGSLEGATVQRMLREMERLSTSLRILGCFQEELWR